MPINLRIVFILASFSFVLYLIKLVNDKKMEIKYSLMWLFISFSMIFAALFPSLFDLASKILGFKYTSNFIMSLGIGFLLFISVNLTIIVSKQKKLIVKLIQEVSIIKKDGI